MAWSAPPNRPSTRHADLAGALERPGHPEARAGEHSVEADHRGEASHVGAGQERLEAAQAEADGRHRARSGALAQRFDRGGGVLLHLGDLQLLDVRHVLELLVARTEPGGAAEVVDRDRGVAGLGEALGQFRVERIQAADVGQDRHTAALARRVLREGGRESGAVGRGQLEQLGAGGAGDRGEHEVVGRGRRARVEVEAHVAPTE